MATKRAKRIVAVLSVGVALVGGIYVMAAWFPGEPATEHRYFARAGRTGPLVIAHRGGAGLWPENTVYAFEQARDLGVDVIETDVQSTTDGALVVMHDASVDRTTDGTGRVAGLTLAELKKLDAGYRWSPDGGKTFPLRGRGITVPTLEEVFTALPDMRFNLEPKQETPSLVKPLCRALRERGMTDRVMVGSFRPAALEEFRRECPEVATSASPTEASKFLTMYKAGLANAYSPVMKALQVPEYAGAMQVLTKDFVAAAHGRKLQVHAWTVNEEADMRRLLDMGVDGIMTDYPDRLLKLLGRAPSK
ncbi:MAG: glycerophosphodiester phosphodiesterase [Pyrinomonadaceae bacterium]